MIFTLYNILLSGCGSVVFVNNWVMVSSKLLVSCLAEMDLITPFSNTACSFCSSFVLILYSAICWSMNLSRKKINIVSNKVYNNVLEIVSPPAEYSIENIEGHYADTIGVSDGFDPSLFTFNLSNNLLETTADIYQNNLFKFTSSEVNFLDYPIKTYWNIDHSGYVGGAWKVSLTYGDFEIDHISPDNELFLRDPSSLLPVSSVDDLDFTILSDADVDIVTGIGDLEVVNRGLVDLFADASAYKIGYYLVYNGVQYKIIEKNPEIGRAHV